MIKRIVGIVMLVAISLTGFSQSNTIKTLEETHEGYSLFLYQSVIRMLNKDENKDFNLLIRDLEYLKVFISDSTNQAAQKDYKEMTLSVAKEGYEELLMIDNKDLKASIYEKELKNGESEYVAFMYHAELGKMGAFEMKGKLDLEYINSFESLDFEQLKKIAETQN